MRSIFEIFPQHKKSTRAMLWLLLLLPTILISFYGYFQTKRIMTESILSRRDSIAGFASSLLQERLARFVDIGTSLATRVRFRQLIADGSWKEAIAILKEIPKDYPMIDRVFLTDIQGILKADYPEVPDVLNKDFSHRDWYLGVSKNWKPYFSELYQRAAAPARNVVALAMPVFSSNQQTIGILVLQIRSDSFWEWSQKVEVGPTGFLYFVDSKGHPLGHPQFGAQEAIADFSKVLAVERALQGQSGVEVLWNEQDQEEFIFSYAPVSSYGWGVIVQQSTQAAFAPLRQLLNSQIILKVIFVAMTGLLSWFLLTALARYEMSESRSRASEERFRAIWENASEAMVTVNRSGNIHFFNPAAEKMFGFSTQELTNQPLTLLIPERFQTAHLEAFARFFETGESRLFGRAVELTGRRKNAEEFSLELSLTSWQSGGDIYITGIIRDLSSHKRAQEKFRDLLESAPDALIIVDIEGRIVLSNSQTESLFGFSFSELIGQHVEILIPERFRKEHSGHRSQYFSDPKFRAMGEGLLLWGLRKDGSEFPVEISLSPLQTENGVLATASIRDITARREVENSLAERSNQLEVSNRELEAFCYSVSHDLRAPLRGIDGFSQALLEDYSERLDEQGKNYLQRVRSGCQRMSALIDDLLGLSRVSRGEMKLTQVELSVIAQEILEEFQKDQPNRVVHSFVEPSLVVEGDSGLLKIALTNLLGNAWKFTRQRSPAKIEFGFCIEQGVNSFFVRDNGDGFNMAYAGKLFSAFQRLHSAEEFEGTGIGLATVQRIIHRHGGRIWVQSEKGKGSTFFFTLNQDHFSGIRQRR